MTKCVCGCGGETKKGNKYINGHNRKGKISGMRNKKHSEETKQKMSNSQRGEKNHFFGKEHTNKTLQKMSQNHWDCSGKKNPFYGKHHTKESIEKIKLKTWKGGRKLTWLKHAHKRRDLGFIPLNEKENENWEAHHINKEYIIYTPPDIHTSIPHNIWENINMDKINDKVYDWFIKYYGLI